MNQESTKFFYYKPDKSILISRFGFVLLGIYWLTSPSPFFLHNAFNCFITAGFMFLINYQRKITPYLIADAEKIIIQNGIFLNIIFLKEISQVEIKGVFLKIHLNRNDKLIKHTIYLKNLEENAQIELNEIIAQYVKTDFK